MITVIAQNTDERKQETIELFNQIKPLLDEGVCLTTATQQVKKLSHRGFCSHRWYKDLREYAESQGYKPRR